MPTINPYALQFGQEPQQLIPRESQLSEVVANFLSDNGLHGGASQEKRWKQALDRI